MLLLTAIAFDIGHVGAAEKALELVIPLREGRYVSVHDYCRVCNDVLKTAYPLDRIPNRDVEITRAEKASLAALSLLWPSYDVRFEKDRVILRLPNPENDAVRQEMRGKLEKALGVSVAAWPAGKGLAIPPNFQPENPAILFVPGLGSSPAKAFGSLIKACTAHKVQVLTFDYPTQGSVKTAGRRLAEELESLGRRYPGARLVVVAHSLGGLVVRYALEKTEPAPSCVTDLFTVGTPHQGSRLADHKDLLQFVRQRLGSGSVSDNLAEGLGEAWLDLRPDSEVLRELGRSSRARSVRYPALLGRKALVEPQDVPGLRREFARYLRRRRLAPEEEQRLLARFDGMDEIINGRGDGVVTLTSARLAGAREKIFDLNHLDLTEGGDRSPVFRYILGSLSWQKD